MKKTLATTTALTLLAALPLTGQTALAQDGGFGASPSQPGIEFEIGGGAQVAPRYEGASEYLVSPLPLIRMKRLTLPNGFQLGGREGGFSIGPSFNIRAERSAADTPALTGLEDVDLAVEFGLEAAYEADYFRLHANLRRGFGGHEGWVGEAGADVIVRPRPDLKVYAGPRVSYADAGYMDTYFTVPAGTAGFTAFDADAGFKSVGLEMGARYDVNADWGIEGGVTYDRLVGNAGDSPITAVGNRDQFSFKLGVVRKFRIDF